MTTRWTQADLDNLREKGIRQINTRAKSQPASFALGRMKAGKMNKSEALYAKHLDVLKQIGSIQWYSFEAINLRLADKCFFMVDFFVMVKGGQLECHECKGGYWTDDALVKIKVAAKLFPFKFIAVKLIKGTWEKRDF